MLKSVGAGGHYPTNKLQSDDGDEAALPSTLLNMLADNAMGRAQALAETVLLVFYKVRTDVELNDGEFDNTFSL
jgi:hypothetical protein